MTLDIQTDETDIEESNKVKKRKVVPPKRVCFDSSDEEESNEDLPPKIAGIAALVEK